MVQVDITRASDQAVVPTYASPGDGGCDLVAIESITLPARGGRALVGTGLVIAIPAGYAGFVHPRSGLALHHGVTCLNSPGLIDAGYRGEIKVLLVNTDPTEDFEINIGDRVAQLVIQKVAHAEFREVPLNAHESTDRGPRGFGSTGVS